VFCRLLAYVLFLLFLLFLFFLLVVYFFSAATGAFVDARLGLADVCPGGGGAALH
jgi:hypothetical protein